MHQIAISVSSIHRIYLNCLNEEFGKKILPENNYQERHLLLSQKKIKVQRCLTNSKLVDKYSTNP